MKELTPEQEDLIGDLAYHDKKVEASIKSAKVGHIPIDPDRVDYIKKRIGRKKLDVGETYNQISGESFGEYSSRRKAEMGDKENEA